MCNAYYIHLRDVYVKDYTDVSGDSLETRIQSHSCISGVFFTRTLSDGQLHIQEKCKPRNQGQGSKVRGSETTRLRDTETLETTVPGNKEIKLIRSRLWRALNTSLKANIRPVSQSVHSSLTVMIFHTITNNHKLLNDT